VVVNPGRDRAGIALGESFSARAMLSDGVELEAGRVEAAGFGYGVFELTS